MCDMLEFARTVANASFVLLANNPLCRTPPPLHGEERVVRFNHCSNQGFYDARVDFLVLRSHGAGDYPWGVNRTGHVSCATQSSTRILRFFDSLPPRSAPSELFLPKTACHSKRGTCSTGYHLVQELVAMGAGRITLVGFSSHLEDQFQASWHDFPSERDALQRMIDSKRVRAVPCWPPERSAVPRNHGRNGGSHGGSHGVTEVT